MTLTKTLYNKCRYQAAENGPKISTNYGELIANYGELFWGA